MSFLLILPLVAIAATPSPTRLIDLPPWQTFVTMEQATPLLVWFRIDFDQIERSSCEIGVPSGGAGEALVNCWVPGIRDGNRETIPEGVRREARAAIAALRSREMDAEEPPTDLDTHYLGTWRKVVLQDLVLRTPDPAGRSISPSDAIFTSTRATFRYDDDHLFFLEDWTSWSTGLLCLASPCTLSNLLDWTAPEPLDGASVLYGLQADDPFALEAWPELEASALRELHAYESGNPDLALPRTRSRPGSSSTAASWFVTVYARDSSGTIVSEARVPFLLDLQQARSSALTFRRRLNSLSLDLSAHIDLPRGEVMMQTTGPEGDIAESRWTMKVQLAKHGALVGPSNLEPSGGVLHHASTAGVEFASLDVHGDAYLLPYPYLPPSSARRLPVAGARRQNALDWTSFEWLDAENRQGYVLGTELRICPFEGSEQECTSQLQGGIGLQDEQSLNLPPGAVRVRVEVFETNVFPEHLWAPRSGDWRSLWVRDFVVQVQAQ